MKKTILLILGLILVLTGCFAKKNYPAKLTIEKESKTYTYFVDGNKEKPKTLTIPTITDQAGKVTEIVYSLNPMVENKNERGLVDSPLFKEDDLDLSYKSKLYEFALFGFGYWQLNGSGSEKVKNNGELTATDYALVHGDFYHQSTINNDDYINYYLAAQELIWESVTDLKTGKPYEIEFENLDLTAFKSEILQNIESSKIAPDFNGTIYTVKESEITEKTPISLTDVKGVIGKYDIKPTQGIDVVSVEENVMTFVVNSLAVNSKIEFVPKFNTTETISKIYSSDDNISYLVVSTDHYLRQNTTLQIEANQTVETTSLTVTTYDSDTKEVLVGAKYQISSDSKFETLIESTSATTELPALFEGLVPGTYYVRQSVAPTGYELNENVEIYTVEAGVSEKDVPFLNKKVTTTE